MLAEVTLHESSSRSPALLRKAVTAWLVLTAVIDAALPVTPEIYPKRPTVSSTAQRLRARFPLASSVAARNRLESSFVRRTPWAGGPKMLLSMSLTAPLNGLTYQKVISIMPLALTAPVTTLVGLMAMVAIPALLIALAVAEPPRISAVPLDCHVISSRLPALLRTPVATQFGARFATETWLTAPAEAPY